MIRNLMSKSSPQVVRDEGEFKVKLQCDERLKGSLKSAVNFVQVYYTQSECQWKDNAEWNQSTPED